MSYNILGINPFHNGSACVLADGEIIYFLEEERLSKFKHDANPFRILIDILNRFYIDEVVLAGINTEKVELAYSHEDPFCAFLRKFYPMLKITKVHDLHHPMHVTQTYFNSGFTNSLGIVIDGGGSIIKDKGIELDSIYTCSPHNIKYIYKNYVKFQGDNLQSVNVATSYSTISQYLGFKRGEEGKTMGLSSYGKYNPSFPHFFKNNLSDVNIINEYLNYNKNKRSNFNASKFSLPLKRVDSLDYSQTEKDLAWKIQNDTQQLVGDYVEKYTKETGLKKVCCSGGYFLNCVANYYLIKRFPDIEFYFEPISHDGGTAIGAAYWGWKQITPHFSPSNQKTLYYGPKYSKEELLEGIKKYI